MQKHRTHKMENYKLIRTRRSLAQLCQQNVRKSEGEGRPQKPPGCCVHSRDPTSPQPGADGPGRGHPPAGARVVPTSPSPGASTPSGLLSMERAGDVSSPSPSGLFAWGEVEALMIYVIITDFQFIRGPQSHKNHAPWERAVSKTESSSPGLRHWLPSAFWHRIFQM